MGGAWDSSFDGAPGQRFLYQAAGGRVVAGVIVSSVDKPGRRYPFLVFTILDPKTMGAQITALPAVLSSFLARAEEEARTGWQGLDLKSFLVRIDSLALPSDFEEAKQSIITFVAGQTNQALWNGLFGSEKDPRKYMLDPQSRRNAEGWDGAAVRPAFPRVSGDAEISFWLELCRKVARRPSLPTLSMWGPGRETAEAGLTFVLDDLKVSYFAPFWWPEKKNNLLFPLADATAGGIRACRRRRTVMLRSWTTDPCACPPSW